MNKFGLEDNVSKIKEYEKAAMDRYGFYIHIVCDNDGKKVLYAHTHGIKETYNQKELCIVADLDSGTSSYIFHDLVDLMKEGTILQQGQEYSGIIKNYNIKIANFKTDENYHLVLLPNVKGNFDLDDKYVAKQLRYIKMH